MIEKDLVIANKHVDARGYVGMGSLMEILKNYQHDYLRSQGLSKESVEAANGGYRLEGERLVIDQPFDLELGNACKVTTSTATIANTLVFTQVIRAGGGKIQAYWHHVLRDRMGRKMPFVHPVR